VSSVERWEEIPGFTMYRVSNLGRVRGVFSGRVLKPRARSSSGHLSVDLYDRGTCRSFLVHRLVALAFLPVRPVWATRVLHADDDPTNNRATNLRWGTVRENARDASRNGRLSGPRRPRLTDEEVLSIRAAAASGESCQSIARRLGRNRTVIERVVSRKTYAEVAS